MSILLVIHPSPPCKSFAAPGESKGVGNVTCRRCCRSEPPDTLSLFCGNVQPFHCSGDDMPSSERDCNALSLQADATVLTWIGGHNLLLLLLVL